MGKLWIENEDGPSCRCGEGKTIVKLCANKPPILWCLQHYDGEGAAFELPKEKPDDLPDDPEKWPEILFGLGDKNAETKNI